jgi:hypothetical protein
MCHVSDRNVLGSVKPDSLYTRIEGDGRKTHSSALIQDCLINLTSTTFDG